MSGTELTMVLVRGRDTMRLSNDQDGTELTLHPNAWRPGYGLIGRALREVGQYERPELNVSYAIGDDSAARLLCYAAALKGYRRTFPASDAADYLSCWHATNCRFWAGLMMREGPAGRRARTAFRLLVGRPDAREISPDSYTLRAVKRAGRLVYTLAGIGTLHPEAHEAGAELVRAAIKSAGQKGQVRVGSTWALDDTWGARLSVLILASRGYRTGWKLVTLVEALVDAEVYDLRYYLRLMLREGKSGTIGRKAFRLLMGVGA